ncbi:MAG: ABC transporter substrate-binding protein [Acholeplasmatales bacterium]|nr:MAG: ABC transporter substrate-binding protein [Acholeplasmatales bacterium]
MKKGLLVTLVLLVVLTLTACQNNDENTLIVLTSSGYEPYEMVDENGQLIGFDIDLMHAIADYLEIEIVWQDVDFDGIIASLQMKQADVAIAGITPTEARAQIVDFSAIYYNSEAGLQNYLLFDSAQGIAALEDLEGLVIGAQLGTIQAELLQSLSETYGFTVDLRSTNAQIVEEIKSNRIDGLVVESLVANAIMAQNSFLASWLVDVDLGHMYGNAIAFTKDSPWLEPFNEALAALEADGTLAALVTKWFEPDVAE